MLILEAHAQASNMVKKMTGESGACENMKVLPDSQNDIPHIAATGVSSHRTPSRKVSGHRPTRVPAC
jgi:hypothetical protein